MLIILSNTIWSIICLIFDICRTIPTSTQSHKTNPSSHKARKSSSPDSLTRKKRSSTIHLQFRPDRKLVKYYEDILKPHEYWDPKPTLRDDKEQQPGNI